jgi:hypothetical protein
MGIDGEGFVGKLLKRMSVAGSMMTREQRAGLARLMLRWPEGRAALHLKAASDAALRDLCEVTNWPVMPRPTGRGRTQQALAASRTSTAC